MDLSHDPDFFAVLTGSYRRRLGAALVPEGADAAWLYEQAPFVVLAHDGGADNTVVMQVSRVRKKFRRRGLQSGTGVPERQAGPFTPPSRHGEQDVGFGLSNVGFGY